MNSRWLYGDGGLAEILPLSFFDQKLNRLFWQQHSCRLSKRWRPSGCLDTYHEVGPEEVNKHNLLAWSKTMRWGFFYLPEGFGIVKVTSCGELFFFLPSPRDLVLSMSPGKGMISVLSSSNDLVEPAGFTLLSMSALIWDACSLTAISILTFGSTPFTLARRASTRDWQKFCLFRFLTKSWIACFGSSIAVVCQSGEGLLGVLTPITKSDLKRSTNTIFLHGQKQCGEGFLPSRGIWYRQSHLMRWTFFLPSPRDLVLSMSPGKGMIPVLSSSNIQLWSSKIIQAWTFPNKTNVVPQPRHTHLTVDLVLEGQRFLTWAIPGHWWQMIAWSIVNKWCPCPSLFYTCTCLVSCIHFFSVLSCRLCYEMFCWMYLLLQVA